MIYFTLSDPTKNEWFPGFPDWKKVNPRSTMPSLRGAHTGWWMEEWFPNVRKNGDKYRRVYWDSIAPCVHTRNDILASQNTVHPQDDRVFSIRELMKMMGLPDSFIWFAGQEEALMKRDIDTLKRHSSNIRQCLGEGVPTPVMRSIGENIATHLVQHLRYLGSRPRKKENSSWTTHAQKAAYQELSDQKRKRLSAHYTEPLAAFAVLKDALGPFKGRKRAIKILEPSVGSGVFLHVLSGMVGGLRVQVTAVDLDPDAIKAVQSHADWFEKKFESIELIEGDYIAKLDGVSYDLVIGNPPFGRTALNVGNKWGTHPEIAVRFLSKAIEQASRVAFVYPKTLLHGVGYSSMRLAMTETGSVESIHDFGELAFPNVKVETIGFIYDREHTAEMDTYLKSWTSNKSWIEKTSYVLDPDFRFLDHIPKQGFRFTSGQM
ncbi:Eco57I restriction-modification methylase domain-containing protein [Corynebacterium suedekumii]|nr:Eco57I restriction-modification methylase domain-containing protein [Corynebacterium suedekumii]